MGKTKKVDQKYARKSPEVRENELINLAYKTAEKRLRDGSASSQLLTHFLKLATKREQLEIERLQADIQLSSAKVDHMQAQETSADLYEKALKAFTTYSGEFSEGDDFDE